MPKGNRGHGVHRHGQCEEEKWISSIKITQRNRFTSTHFVMGDWDSISADRSRPCGFECVVGLEMAKPISGGWLVQPSMVWILMVAVNG
nr:hypothetical protein CFP56_10573 [Quercus suber]